MTNIILCGGSGTRLWPVSRTLMPKQFVKFFDDRSLFQLTVARNAPLCDRSIIVSNEAQFFLATDQLEEMGAEAYRSLLEPMGRNTAPAIALACMALDAEETVLVTPSDHLIRDEAAYTRAVQRAMELAVEGALVTFGITPRSPETGFGYIEAEGERVRAFHEKPDRETARRYLDSGNYYWNSGMFCFKAGVYLRELERHAPEIYEASQQAFEQAWRDRETLIRIRPEAMEAIPEESIDYAVMEKSTQVRVVPTEMGWSDLGSFDALYEELPKDAEGNTENPHHIGIDSRNNLVYGDQRTIATVEIEDLMIVDTPDALLVCRKGASQKVKEIVRRVKEKSDLHNAHLTVHRPWGTYTVLEDTPGYKIKRIVVKPGKRLSLQKHYHRNEHWIVVSGTATVTVGDETKIIRPNESTYIRMGEVHRLANEGVIPVVLIEAQVGEYTGEDDIVRLEDDYHRTEEPT